MFIFFLIKLPSIALVTVGWAQVIIPYNKEVDWTVPKFSKNFSKSDARWRISDPVFIKIFLNISIGRILVSTVNPVVVNAKNCWLGVDNVDVSSFNSNGTSDISVMLMTFPDNAKVLVNSKNPERGPYIYK